MSKVKQLKQQAFVHVQDLILDAAIDNSLSLSVVTVADNVTVHRPPSQSLDQLSHNSHNSPSFNIVRELRLMDLNSQLFDDYTDSLSASPGTLAEHMGDRGGGVDIVDFGDLGELSPGSPGSPACSLQFTLDGVEPIDPAYVGVDMHTHRVGVDTHGVCIGVDEDILELFHRASDNSLFLRSDADSMDKYMSEVCCVYVMCVYVTVFLYLSPTPYYLTVFYTYLLYPYTPILLSERYKYAVQCRAPPGR
jgi:hypothetical protein